MAKVRYLFYIMIVFASCEPDDICGEVNARTPQIVFRIYDASQPTQLKSIDTLRVVGAGQDDGFEFLNVDSIALPLRVDAAKTTFGFTNAINATDSIHLSYETNDLYLNRACGFRTIFSLDEATTSAPAQWIQSIEILQNEILIDTLTHVKIYH